MKYIDGVLTAVKTAKKQAFIDFSQATVALFREAGALEVVDCWGTDVPEGKVTSFPMAVKLEADEAVCFSWVLWPSKEARDAGWKKIEADPRFGEMGEMPFDGQRMVFGGFEMVSEG